MAISSALISFVTAALHVMPSSPLWSPNVVTQPKSVSFAYSNKTSSA